ncbi:MAG: T9SS type A sorting domain-containing protein [Bacteroidetes bacterium]|nr:T9SS type A sorting domain-containing protein [Bacteroidota bacterium]
MKKLITISIILLHGFSCLGQGYNHNYLLGYDVVGMPPYTSSGKAIAEIDSINFNVFSQVRKMKFMEAQANISDSAGNLLFYTNGCWIANATGDTMVNGGGLNPGPFANGYCSFGFPKPITQVILPYPDSVGKYLLLHQTGDVSVYPRNLYYSIIDMSLDSGRGAVTLKNQIAFSDTLVFGVTACKHANGRDWWVAVLKDSSDVVFTVLLTPNGITNIQQQHLNVPMHTSFSSIQAFSPDGTKYAYITMSPTGIMGKPYKRDIRLFDFDRCSGLFSNSKYTLLPDSIYGLGLGFSPNSKLLYQFSQINIYQYDLQAAQIWQTQQLVAQYDTFSYGGWTDFCYMYLAANGKFYISSCSGAPYFGVIDQPDSAGLTCNVLQHAVQTPCYLGFSHVNHPNYYLDRLIGSPCDTLTSINDLKEHDFHFSIAPNPSNGSFKIMYLLPQNCKGTFEVFDITGKKVFSYNLPPWSTMQYISLPKIASGIYQCVITSGNERVHKKLVVFKE